MSAILQVKSPNFNAASCRGILLFGAVRSDNEPNGGAKAQAHCVKNSIYWAVSPLMGSVSSRYQAVFDIFRGLHETYSRPLNTIEALFLLNAA